MELECARGATWFGAPWPPGVREVAGRPYVFDRDLLSDWMAVEAKIDAPDALCDLDDRKLDALAASAQRLIAMSRGVETDLARNIADERARRGRETTNRTLGPVALSPEAGVAQPRYRASGGDVLDGLGRRVPLGEAGRLIQAWSTQARRADKDGRRRLARAYARPAADLQDACHQARAWRRAAGWRDPS